MSIGYNSQDDEGSINFEENPNARLVCPECDDDETVLQVILNLEYLGLAEITLGQKEELDHG